MAMSYFLHFMSFQCALMPEVRDHKQWVIQIYNVLTGAVLSLQLLRAPKTTGRSLSRVLSDLSEVS